MNGPECDKGCYKIFHMTGGNHQTNCARYNYIPPELIGDELDLAVAKALGKFAYIRPTSDGLSVCVTTETGKKAVDDEYELFLTYSTNWSQGGPLIEEYHINIVWHDDGTCTAALENDPMKVYGGLTPLIAAMRAFVASRA